MERMSIEEAITHAREVAKKNREDWKNCLANRDDIKHQTCEQCAEEHEQLAKWLEELKEYRQFDEQGFLLKLPCKEGSSVHLICSRYTKCSKYGKEFEEYDCQGCEEECDSRKEHYIYTNDSVSLEWIVRNMSKFGKTAFLSQSKAEEALKRMNR